MVTIWSATHALARCSLCGVQQQFHERLPNNPTHAFKAETISDYEPGDLSPEQLVGEIARLQALLAKLCPLRLDLSDDEWAVRNDHEARRNECQTELRRQVCVIVGVDWDDLVGSVDA